MKRGDTVDAHFIGEVIKQVEIISFPATTGEMLFLKEKDGTIHAINTVCSSFEGLILHPKKDT